MGVGQLGEVAQFLFLDTLRQQACPFSELRIMARRFQYRTNMIGAVDLPDVPTFPEATDLSLIGAEEPPSI